MRTYITFDKEFDRFYRSIPEEILKLNGISKELMDVGEMSHNYFTNNWNEGGKIDHNANSNKTCVVNYASEVVKPLMKLEGVYLLHRYLRKSMSSEKADRIIMSVLSGDMYVHDFSGVGIQQPYSYSPYEIIDVMIDGIKYNMNMKQLFDYGSMFEQCESNDVATWFNINETDVKVLDSGKYVDVTCVMEKDNLNDMYMLRLSDGSSQIVTDNHPMITPDGEKIASDLEIGDVLTTIKDKHIHKLNEYCGYELTWELGYATGFIIGDGCECNDRRFVSISQKIGSPERDSIINVYNTIGINYADCNGTHKNIVTYDKDFYRYISSCDLGYMSQNRRLPHFWKEAPIEYIAGLVSGIFDAEGTLSGINRNIPQIRVTSRTMVLQLHELISMFGGYSSISSYEPRKYKNSYESNSSMYSITFKGECEFIDWVYTNSIKLHCVGRPSKQGSHKIDERGNVVVTDIKIYERDIPYVYDITTETGTFTCNGIHSHNCFAFSTHWILENGTPFGQLPSTPPMHTRSFIGQVAEMVMSMSQQFAGATAPADVLVAYAHLAKKEHLTAKEIENDLQSLVHILNKEFRGGSQCVTEDTEVLTPYGFKKYDELLVGDDIYTWNDGHLNIQKVQRVNVYEHDGEMHRYSGTGVEQVVSPNHRVLYKKYNSDEYCLTESHKIINNKTPVSIPVAMLTDTREDCPISDDMLKMCVFILTDGSYRQKSSALRWYKSPRRWGAEEFENVCEELGFTYKTSTRPDGFDNGGNVVQYDIPSRYGECIREHIPCKSYVPEWMFNLSKRQANIVIDLWAKLDGHTTESGRQKLQCDNYDIADAIQHICFLAGHGSSIQERYIGNNRSPTIYVVPYKNKNKTASTMDTIEYTGKIWCPTTEDGVVVFRKDGKIFISGNSAYSNVSIFDRPGLEHLFGDMLYSDGTGIDIDYVMFVQEVFMDWFSRGIPETGEPYRFPVVTANVSTDDNGNILDDDFVSMLGQYNTPTGCFNIHSGESSKIASCCRLTSSLEDMRKYNQDSFGNGGLNIGSTHVVTINLPRVAMRTITVLEDAIIEPSVTEVQRVIDSVLSKQMLHAATILDTHRTRILSRRIEQGFFPVVDVGMVDINTMFSTFGFTGVPEFVEILGYDITSEEGIAIAGFVMDKMDELSLKISDEHGYAFNVEEVPAESASVTLRDLDVLKYGDDYAEFIGKEMYSNQFIPLTYDVPIIDRVTITGQLMAKATGGAIMHLNLDERITNESTMENLIRWTISKGVQHFAINYGFSRCINGHSTPGIVDKCSDCSGEIEDYLTRIVGYFVPVKSWNKRRQVHDFPNRVAYYVNGDVE